MGCCGVGSGSGWGDGSGFRVEADRNMSCQGGEMELELGSEYGTSSIIVEVRLGSLIERG